MSDNRYAKTTFDGHTVDQWTAAALRECEKRLGYPLTIVQGSYNGTAVTASAGTHAGGGVVDLAPYDWKNKVRVLREVGFAAWHRLPSQGPWGEHIHAVLIGDMKAAPSALAQVHAYKNGHNGLANNGPDDGPKVGVHEFAYPPKEASVKTKPAPKRSRVEAARDLLKEAIKATDNPIRKRHIQAMLDAGPEK